LPHFEPWHVLPPKEGPQRASFVIGCDGVEGFAEGVCEGLLGTTIALVETRAGVVLVFTEAGDSGEHVPNLLLHPLPH
jgi:hypothetical protein